MTDKEPSVGALWTWAFALCVVATLLEMLRPRLGLLVVPVAALSAWAGQMELSDPYVGPAILTELGSSYVSTSYLTYAVSILGPVIVMVLSSIIRRG